MRLSIHCRSLVKFAIIGILVLAFLSACASESRSEPPADTPVSVAVTGIPPSEVIVYASDLPLDALYELDFMDDPASPSGKMIGLPNTGDELDPPPENDPHATFRVQVQSGTPYRCWIHMKVGTPKGKSQANVIWVQVSDAVDKANREILEPGTENYLTAQGPTQEGWTWVSCNMTESALSEPLIYFRSNGEVTVQLQAGAEGVGFDQFLLSPTKFLNGPPSESIVER
jgi:hypothetical protein